MRKRRQVKKNIPVVLTTLEGGGSAEFSPICPAPHVDSGGSSENRVGGGDGAGLGEAEGAAGADEGETT